MGKLVFGVGLMLLALFSHNTASAYEIGSKVPALEIDEFLSEKDVHLDGKYIFIDFWATWCGPCIASMPHVDRMADKLKDKVVFLAVTNEKEEKMVRDFIAKRLKFENIVFAMSSELSSTFDVEYIPYYAFLSPDLTLLAQGHSASATAEQLEQLMSGADVRSVQKGRKDSAVKVKGSVDRPVISFSITKPEKQREGWSSARGYYNIRYTGNVPNAILTLTGNKRNLTDLTQVDSKEVVHLNFESYSVAIDSVKDLITEIFLRSLHISHRQEKRKVDTYRIKMSSESKLVETIMGEGNKSVNIYDGIAEVKNYTVDELLLFCEGNFKELLVTSKYGSTKCYDWELPLLKLLSMDDPVGGLRTELKDRYGIGLLPKKKKMVFDVYYQ